MNSALKRIRIYRETRDELTLEEAITKLSAMLHTIETTSGQARGLLMRFWPKGNHKAMIERIYALARELQQWLPTQK